MCYGAFWVYFVGVLNDIVIWWWSNSEQGKFSVELSRYGNFQSGFHERNEGDRGKYGS
jgi:formylmethanofuran dehydrogenase subunit B